MRIVATILFILCSFFSFAAPPRHVYVSNAGNDITGTGTILLPYASIAKVNSIYSGLSIGDTVSFRRGDTFYGGLIISRSGLAGQPMVIDDYGTGAKPIFTGLSTVTGWVNLGGNIWEAPTVNVKIDVNLVLREGAIQQIGRYPNANATNGGYLNYTAATTTSITGNAMSATTDWTGAEVAIRLFRWEIRKRKVTSHSGGTIGFATIADISTTSINRGYFFQRDARTVDQDGEWFQNGTTNKLRMYFANNNPNAYTIQIASVDTLIKSTANSQIVIKNISLTGCNKAGIFQNGGTGVAINGCDATNIGADGITTWFTTNVVVDGCTTDRCLGSALRIFGPSSGTANLTVKNNNVNHTALIAGMETQDVTGNANAVHVNGGDNVQILHNVIRNSGYNAIKWHGNNVYIKYNLIDSFCIVRDDGAGIYTYTGPGSTIVRGTNRNIISNIVLHGIGAQYGTPMTDVTTNGIAARFSANGIYLDEGTWDVVIDSNTVANIAFHGLQGNGNSYVTIRHNTIFNTYMSHAYQRLRDENPMTNFIIKKNIFYPYRLRLRDQAINLPTPASQDAVALRLGILDSNYYSSRTGTDTSLDIQTDQNPHISSPNSFSENFRAFAYITGTLDLETASISSANTGIIEYNASDTIRIVVFNGLRKIDPKGNIYNNYAAIPPWGSRVLIANGTVNISPTANAGPDQFITLPQTTTSLTGSGNDPDGSISSYSWFKLPTSPAGGNLSNANIASPNLSALQAGTYQYQLQVTDNLGATGNDIVQITASAANINPVANAGVPITITLPVTTAALSGSGTDQDGTISSYAWVKTSGPAGGTISNANIASPNLSALQQGVYQYQLTVTDNSGGTGTATVQVTVNPANIAPVSNAGPNRIITLPTNTTTLNGSGTDADGTISNYSWVKISGPATGTIATPNAATTVLNNLAQGTYVFELTVTDNSGATGQATVQVKINPSVIPPNIPPAANAGTDIVIKSPVSTTTLTGSGTDADGTISAYHWTLISSPIGGGGAITTSNAASTGLTGLIQGVYQYQLRVTDNNLPVGDTAIDVVQVTVNAANIFPISNAGTDKVVTLPVSTTTLVGSGTDADGSISSYHWIKLSGPAGGTIATPNAATTNLSALQQGDYYYQLTVTDNNTPIGDTSADVVKVTVNAANVGPVVSAGPNKLVALPIDTVTLFGSATDIDGSISTYAWVKVSGPSGATITPSNTAVTILSGLLEGVYYYQLTATDNSGASNSASVQVTVQPAPTVPPTANAGTHQYITLPVNQAILTGVGTPFNGATIDTYAWTDVAGNPTTGTIQSPSEAITYVTALIEGDYTYLLTVTDSNGLTATATITITVYPLVDTSRHLFFGAKFIPN